MSALRCVCPHCGHEVNVTGRGTIARHTARSQFSWRERHCEGSATAAKGVEKWATEQRRYLRARVDGHAAMVADIRAKAAQSEELANKYRDDAAAELDAIDAALAKYAKKAGKTAAAEVSQ